MQSNDRKEKLALVRPNFRGFSVDQLEEWNVRILQMADAIEADVAGVARHASCPAELILDALTLELTRRFIGSVRERDEQILKSQPIVWRSHLPYGVNWGLRPITPKLFSEYHQNKLEDLSVPIGISSATSRQVSVPGSEIGF